MDQHYLMSVVKAQVWSWALLSALAVPTITLSHWGTLDNLIPETHGLRGLPPTVESKGYVPIFDPMHEEGTTFSTLHGGHGGDITRQSRDGIFLLLDGLNITILHSLQIETTNPKHSFCQVPGA